MACLTAGLYAGAEYWGIEMVLNKFQYQQQKAKGRVPRSVAREIRATKILNTFSSDFVLARQSGKVIAIGEMFLFALKYGRLAKVAQVNKKFFDEVTDLAAKGHLMIPFKKRVRAHHFIQIPKGK